MPGARSVRGVADRVLDGVDRWRVLAAFSREHHGWKSPHTLSQGEPDSQLQSLDDERFVAEPAPSNDQGSASTNVNC